MKSTLVTAENFSTMAVISTHLAVTMSSRVYRQTAVIVRIEGDTVERTIDGGRSPVCEGPLEATGDKTIVPDAARLTDVSPLRGTKDLSRYYAT